MSIEAAMSRISQIQAMLSTGVVPQTPPAPSTTPPLPPQPEATSASVTTTPKKPTNQRFTRTISFRSTHRGSVLSTDAERGPDVSGLC